MKYKLFSMTFHEMEQLCEKVGIRRFHANQLATWVFQRGVTLWENMTDISKDHRKFFSDTLVTNSLTLVRTQLSDDKQTTKFLWRLNDGKLVESVLIEAPDRKTVCVSSQVGCPARCAFCASGKNGLFRNLEVEEIIEQVWSINEYLRQRGEHVSHVVYMGMGEPLWNYDNVIHSLKILTDPKLFNLSQRRITVSTVGVIDGILRFACENMKVNLVLSLHAPNQHLRKKIIPFARQNELQDILSAMLQFAEKTKRDITFEYTLLAGINDQPEHAHELAKLVRNMPCTINLIPYNPVEGLRLKRPNTKTIQEFRSILDSYSVVNTCRYTKGDDIAAACGQLALQQDTATASPFAII